MTTADLLPIALRAYAVPADATDPEATPNPKPYRRPQILFVFDCETTTDAAQQLTFGSWRVYEQVRGRAEYSPDNWTLLEEGLFHADDIPDEFFAILRDYRRVHWYGTGVELQLLSRRKFVEQVLWRWAYQARALIVGYNLPFDLSRLAVGWGQARKKSFAGGFSLVLWDYWDTQTGAWREHPYRPRIAIKTIDAKRHLIGFTRPVKSEEAEAVHENLAENRADRPSAFSGHFLDGRTLAFALTNRGYSLASACRAFGVEHGKFEGVAHGRVTSEYIDYNRRDVLATFELALKLLEEFDRHPTQLAETHAYSPASLGKAYVRAMGIPPILQRQADFTPEVLGYAMTAFYGGRAECRIRRMPVPVVYVDFLSMYPTVNANMNLWEFLTAKRVSVEEDTENVVQFLHSVTLDDCFTPETWRHFPVLVQVQPDGDILPVRAQYEGPGTDWQIGVNPLQSDDALWYALPDIIAAKVLTGKTARVVRALRLVASTEKLDTLRGVQLRGEIAVDPRRQDFFRTVIEERKRLPDEQQRLGDFLKVLANAASYGIFAQMDRKELATGEKATVTVHGLTDFSARVAAPEEPGAYCFPPIAACITAAARLMLALLERSVTDAGGTYAMCDTDSMAIVSTEQGGLAPCPGGAERPPDGTQAVQTLSWAEVEAIRERFASLNPYASDAVHGSILEVEKENYELATGRQRQLWCYAISAKRYILFQRSDSGEPVPRTVAEERDAEDSESAAAWSEPDGLLKQSEHGLGHLLNPRDPTMETEEAERGTRGWIREAWQYLLALDTGLHPEELPWLDRPAISRITASSPRMLDPFETYNDHLKTYAAQVKPFNFLLSTHVASFGHPAGVDAHRFHLIAPYTTDAQQWLKMNWTDLYAGREYRIITGSSSSATLVRVKAYHDVLATYRANEEIKFLGPDAAPCRSETRGLLQRRPVQVIKPMVHYIGKESNLLEDVQAGLVHDLADVLSEYPDPQRDPWHALIVPVLRDMPKAELARLAEITERQVQRLRNGQGLPHPSTRTALTEAAADFVRAKLVSWGKQVPLDPLAACAVYLTQHTDAQSS